MDTLIVVIISGMAVSYVTEFVGGITDYFFSQRVVRLILTAPLSFVACWFLGLSGFELIVASLAAGFFSAALLLLLNLPATIQTVSNTRRR